MSDFYVPPEGIYFRIIGYVSSRALYSRTSKEPTFGGFLASVAPYQDQYFSLVKGTGDKGGLFLIKSRETGYVLFSRAHPAPHVGHINGRYDDNWFKLDPGTGQFTSMVRLVVPSTETVVVSRDNTDEIDNYPAKHQVYPDQFFAFEYEDMVVDRIEYELRLGKIIASTPRVLASQTLDNNTDHKQEMSFAMSEKQTQTSSFDYTTGLTLSVGATIKAGIPEIAEGEFRMDTSISETWTYGKTESFEKTYTASFPVKAGPHMTVHAVSTVNVGTLEVPYTLYLSSKSTGTKAETRGIWRGVSSWALRHSISQVPK
ncbi:hemolytic lectin [Mycena latifolia]|nr:hemolytic lectin [Mycena latifolia]